MSDLSFLCTRPLRGAAALLTQSRLWVLSGLSWEPSSSEFPAAFEVACWRLPSWG